jgi:hypothetical protein
MLAAVVAAAAVPLGFALSLNPHPEEAVVAPVPMSRVVVSAIAPMNSAVPLPSPPRQTPPRDIPDAAKLLSMGTLLIGLAEVVRRAV